MAIRSEFPWSCHSYHMLDSDLLDWLILLFYNELNNMKLSVGKEVWFWSEKSPN